jgi:hypothetical protein
LKIAFEWIVDLLNLPKRRAIERLIQPKTMTEHRDGKITAMQNPRFDFAPETIDQMAASIQ